jgi:hypothetical protein
LEHAKRSKKPETRVLEFAERETTLLGSSPALPRATVAKKV